MTTDVKTETTQLVATGDLFGEGADLTGRSVEYWGRIWTVTGKNYLGDWDVERHEDRPDGRYRIHSSVCPRKLPEDHPHFASLLSSSNQVVGPRAYPYQNGLAR